MSKKKKKLPKKISKEITDNYYSKLPDKINEKLSKFNKAINKKNKTPQDAGYLKPQDDIGSLEEILGVQQAKDEQDIMPTFWDSFPIAPSEVPLNKLSQKHFDKVYAPLKTLIPEPIRHKYGNVEWVILEKYLGKPNVIRYYTKNKTLTDAQCKILYEHEEWRASYGFLINDKPLDGKYFASYIQWLINNTRDEDEAEEKALTEISKPLQTNPDGSREPIVIQMGVNSYMKRNSLTNPVQIIDAHVKKEKLKIYDAQNLGGILSELNVTPQEALDYVCAYLNKNRDIKRKHTQDRELNRGAGALKKLLDFYKAEKERTTMQKLKDKKVKVFGYKELMQSKQYADYCVEVGDLQIREYETFKKWIRKKLDVVAMLDKK